MNRIQMTATVFLALALANANAAPNQVRTDLVRPTVAVNGVKPQNILTPDASSTTMTVENQKWSPEKDRPFIVRATGKEVTGKDWKEYSFSFTPSKDGYVWISLEGQYPAKDDPNKTVFKVDYDKVTVTGGAIENGDFEVRTEDGRPKFWKYAKDVIPPGSVKEALSGSNFVTVSALNGIGCGLKVTAGQPVTVTFSARAHTD